MSRNLMVVTAAALLPNLMTSCLTLAMWDETLDFPYIPEHHLEFELDTITTLQTQPGQPAQLHVELPQKDGPARTWFRLSQTGGNAHLDAILAQPGTRNAPWQVLIDEEERRDPNSATVRIRGELADGVGRIEPVPTAGMSTAPSVEPLALNDHPWLRWLGIDSPARDVEAIGWVHRRAPGVDPDALANAFERADFATLRDHELVIRIATQNGPPVEARLHADALWFATHATIRTDDRGVALWTHRSTWGTTHRHPSPETRREVSASTATGIQLSFEGSRPPSPVWRVAKAVLLTPFTLGADAILGPYVDISRPFFGMKERPIQVHLLR